MSFYYKFLTVAAIIGMLGIPVFVFDHDNYTWEANREAYWGIISCFCLAAAIAFIHKAKQLEK